MNRQPLHEFVINVHHHELHGFSDLALGHTPSKQSLPPQALEIFHRLNQTIFGQQLLTLKSCDFCNAAADLNEMAIYLEPAFVERIRSLSNSEADFQLLLGFVLAHEIGHYLYELAVRHFGGFSPNGNRSYSALRDDWGKCNQERQRAHVEVDLIGLEVLGRVGWPNKAQRISEFLSDLNFSCDGAARVRAMSSMAKN